MNQLSASRTDSLKTRDFLSRVRHATWQLLVGEIAGDATFGLASGAIDQLSEGIKDMDQLVNELKETPESERKLAKDTQLAMRFDAMLARRSILEKRLEISRKDELDRLAQLREINRVYRELVRNLTLGRTSEILGQSDEALKFGEETVKGIADIERVAGQRRDFYLFRDEPSLTDSPLKELELVREVAKPVSNDVLRHQQAIQAFNLVGQNQQSELVSRENLELAKRLAEASLKGSDAPNILAHWAIGISCRELGRLEVIQDPWNAKSHQRAAVWFDQARKSLSTANTQSSGRPNPPSWVANVANELTELNSPDVAIQRAMSRLSSGYPEEAIAALERCATIHRSERVAELLVDAKRFSGSSIDELDQLVEHLWRAGVFDDKNEKSRLIRGRQGVLGTWQQLADKRLAFQPDANRSAFISRLDAAVEDLSIVSRSKDPKLRRFAESYISLSSVIRLLIAPDLSSDNAKSHLGSVAYSVEELQQDIDLVPLDERVLQLEALVTGRLAQGYLALRFLPNYRDMAPKSFALATDLRAMVPSGLRMPQVLGEAVWHSVVARVDAADARLAHEEQSIRRSIQRVLPGISALILAPTIDGADSLRAITCDLESAGSLRSDHLLIDFHETSDSRAAAGAELRTATILAYLAARKPVQALRECLEPMKATIDSTNPLEIDVESLRPALLGERDPVRQAIIALALEEVAVDPSLKKAEKTPVFLKLALEMQRHAGKVFAESSIYRKTHSAEVELNRRAIQRLTEPEFYLNLARERIADARLNEAKELLEAGVLRHPDSVGIREALIETLIDEADLHPSQSENLIAKAVEQLRIVTAKESQDVYGAMMTLAGLHERLGEADTAKSIYGRIANRSTDHRQRLLARSRMALINVHVK